MTRREELIKELERLRWINMKKIFDGESIKTSKALADFILADRRTQIAKVIDPLQRYISIDKSGWIGRPQDGFTHEDVMKKSILIANELMKG